jgi:hypothetical protein
MAVVCILCAPLRTAAVVRLEGGIDWGLEASG